MLKPLEVIRRYPAHDYTVWSLFTSRAGADPDRAFIACEGRSHTRSQFAAAVDRMAWLLCARGVSRGDRVAIMARNSEAHVLLLLALSRLGAIMVPVNPEFGVAEARYVLEHAAVSAVVASHATLATAQDAAAGMAGVPWFAVIGEAAGDVPGLNALAAAAAPCMLPADVSAEDTCLIVYTSGTTGFPKGVMHSQRSFVLCGEASVQRVHLQPNDKVMVLLPLFHINALFYSLAGALAAGAAMEIVPRFSATTFWDTVAESGVTQLNIIEAVGSILKARPRSEFRPDHRLRVVYGVRQAVADTFRNEFHIPHLVGGYGMTEIPGVTCNPFDSLQKPGSMGPLGRHPDPGLPWAQCRVVDDEGCDVPVNAEGELVVKTPILMQGYFRDPEQTRAAFRDGWFVTGDLVRRDADGYFFFISRKKDIIRRRGENISGAELDRIIGEHPAVYEVAAIAVPAELGEDEILAAIVVKPGHAVSADEIAGWCRERLAPMKVPRYVVFVGELPHTPTHKILKSVLRADAALRQRATDLQAAAPACG